MKRLLVTAWKSKTKLVPSTDESQSLDITSDDCRQDPFYLSDRIGSMFGHNDCPIRASQRHETDHERWEARAWYHGYQNLQAMNR